MGRAPGTACGFAEPAQIGALFLWWFSDLLEVRRVKDEGPS